LILSYSEVFSIYQKQGIWELRHVKAKVLKRKGGIHCEENRDFSLEREGPVGQLAFGEKVVEFCDLF
jgi:hypothetical protein